jgi:gliding motility-associated-like protein
MNRSVQGPFQQRPHLMSVDSAFDTTPELEKTSSADLRISMPLASSNVQGDARRIFPGPSLRRREDAAPVITGQIPNPLTTEEETPLTITLNNLAVTDPDSQYPSDFTLVVATGSDYTVSGNTITPLENFNGTLSVTVTVNDGELDSQPFHVQVSVTPVNDAPTITGQTPNPISTVEARAVDISLNNLVVTDPDNVYPVDFAINLLSGDNYSVSGSGISPSPGFSGMLSVNVSVTDGSATSAVFPLQVSVAANSSPVITGQTTLITNEEVPLAITFADLSVTDPDNSYPEGFTLRLLEGSHYITDGFSITPEKDYAGPLSVPVIVNDGTSDSAPFNLQVAVQNQNDAPEITGQVPLSISENSPFTLALSHLTVSDPDNDPATLTVSVMGGENYSVSGTTITPASGFNGDLTVGVFVNDGAENSNIFYLTISVNPVNDPPVITGQTDLTVSEDNALTFTLQNLVVSDPDNDFPAGFTLIVQPGADYSTAGTTVTPSANFNGTLSVSVVVNDGMSDSAPFPVQISVLPVNDAPVITGPASLSTNEDQPRAISISDLAIVDPDNSSGFILTVSQGAHYTVSATTITPAPDFYGNLNVSLQVSDGLLNSNVFAINLEVVPVDDAPVITGQSPVETPEDTPVMIELRNLTVLDIDSPYPSGFSLAVAPGTNYTFSGSTVVPARDFNGTLNVNITVSDGVSSSPPFLFQIQVGDANDAPVITGQNALTTDEEKPVTLQLSDLLVTDPDNAFPGGFTLLVAAGINYTVSGQTITPAINFSGVLTVPVRVNDGINNSASYDFKLQVAQVNDPPSFAPIPNQQISENGTAGSLIMTGVSKGPFEENQQLTFVATSGNTAVVEDPVIQYPGTGSSAVLSYAIKPNTSGVVTITVVAIDNGSNAPPNQNTYSSTFQVEVLEVNSAPTLDVMSPITILEDAEQQNIAITGISAGPGEMQTLTASVTSNRSDLFDVLAVDYTSPAPSGFLRLKSRPEAFGTAKIAVTITDDGPGTPPHSNTITRSFDITIQPVNDPPVFTSSPVVVAASNEEYEYRITTTDPDGDKLTLSAETKPAWASFTSLGNGVARLAGKPPASAFGKTAVRLLVKDAQQSVDQSFELYVNARPSVTPLSIVTGEDNAFLFPANFFSDGYSDLNGDPLVSVQVTALPASGKLWLSSREVSATDTISFLSLGSLRYEPGENFYGRDSFSWKAFDGYNMSGTSSRVDISVLSINDPPLVTFEADTLKYEVNGEPALLSPLVVISDPDDDTLRSATIAFAAQHYRPEIDLLQFTNRPNIKGVFDYQRGALELTGIAPLSDYLFALRSVTYLHQNTLDPILEPKTVFVVLNDGEEDSAPREKIIMLQYTFIEFNIPSGFTPNGDHANDTWIIQRPGGGLEELDNAVISVYNRKGVLVFRARGFDRPWDGTMNGERLPADSYFFTIDLQLRNKKTYKGVVTILR